MVQLMNVMNVKNELLSLHYTVVIFTEKNYSSPRNPTHTCSEIAYLSRRIVY